jgi:hypothetical protein
MKESFRTVSPLLTTGGIFRNLNLTPNTWIPGVTALLELAPNAIDEPSAVILSSSDDVDGFFSLDYGHRATGAGWWLHQAQEGIWRHYAISNRLATYDGTNRLGSMMWLGWGLCRGTDASGARPAFIEFDDAASRDSMFIRSGKRLVGDRVRLAANPALGGPVEQVVVAQGYEGIAWLANYSGYLPPDFDALNGKGFTQVIKPNPSNSQNTALQLQQRFTIQSYTGTTPSSGGTEPKWPTTLNATVTEEPPGTITWVNVGTAPTYGAVNARVENLTTIALPSGSSYTLTAIQAMGTRLRFTGALTANYSVILQTPAQFGASPGSNSAQWLVQNNTSGAFTLTFQTTATDPGVLVPQGQSRILWSDGVNMFLC